MKTHNQKIGRWGEEIASAYLQKRGYKFVDANVRTPYGEIDLILRLNEITIFVEVKTRTSTRYGYPEEAITPQKQQHMLESAGHYVQEHEIDFWRVDAVSVIGKPSGKEPEITHFKDVL